MSGSAAGRRLVQTGRLPRSPATLAYRPRQVPRAATKSAPEAVFPRSRRIPFYLLIGTSGLGGLYTVSVYLSYRREAEKALTHNIPLDVSDRYQRTAEHYDEDVAWMEWIMGITKLRKQLVEKAKGNVLEVSVGTGRNAPYYPLLKGIKSMTMVDQSSEMIRQARTNWPKTCAYFINASFRHQSAADHIPCPDPAGFDTIVQTMGICSTPEPEKVLENLGRLCKQETGRILLLEHGKSYYSWLNNFLDSTAPAHADRHGCWYNKDIDEIVKKSGLEIVEQKRYHFGTTWWYELKPRKSAIILADGSQKKEEISPKPWYASLWG
jgi:methyltransferase OMS1